MPAGFCGIFGIKPTFGVVPAYPQSTMGNLSHHGPMTRTVTDAALMLTVISEPDPRDWSAGPYRMINYHENLQQDISGLRIAYSPTLGYAKVDEHVSSVVEQSVRRFAELGAEVVEVDPGIEDPIETMITLWSVGLAVLIDGIPKHKHDLMDQPILALAEQGRKCTSLTVRNAEKAREQLAVKINLFLEEYDLLITPQLPLTAFEAGNEVPPGSGMTRWWEWSPFTYPFNPPLSIGLSPFECPLFCVQNRTFSLWIGLFFLYRVHPFAKGASVVYGCQFPSLFAHHLFLHLISDR